MSYHFTINKSVTEFIGRNCAFVNFTNIANAIKAIECIKLKPEYANLRVSHGKDRCANPPRIIAPGRGVRKNAGGGGARGEQGHSVGTGGGGLSASATGEGDLLSQFGVDGEGVTPSGTAEGEAEELDPNDVDPLGYSDTISSDPAIGTNGAAAAPPSTFATIATTAQATDKDAETENVEGLLPLVEEEEVDADLDLDLAVPADPFALEVEVVDNEQA